MNEYERTQRGKQLSDDDEIEDNPALVDAPEVDGVWVHDEDASGAAHLVTSEGAEWAT